jgi:hypothetical protein
MEIKYGKTAVTKFAMMKLLLKWREDFDKGNFNNWDREGATKFCGHLIILSRVSW